MSRAKIQKKATFIDMTAMSDVTVLLLTFFMLTASFVKKEPVQVVTPSSVSEIKIPETNLLSILVDTNGKGVTFTPQEVKKFSLFQTFGVPMKNLKSFLALSGEEQDKVLKNQGIPCDSIDNQFKAWVRHARIANPDLRIAIKADQQTPYMVIKKVMNSLQDLKENRYNLITSLKTSAED